MIGPHSRCLLHALAARVGVQWYLGAHRSSSWEARRCHAAPSAMPPYTGRVLQQTYGSHAYVVDITLGGWNGTGCPTGGGTSFIASGCVRIGTGCEIDASPSVYGH